ncbi:hypothetical protein KY290_030034, partial [Solanum tuberosum]
VDYQNKQFAQGVIPTTYMRREDAPKERELLCGRLIDRPIRPLFPPGFYHEVQVMASVLSSDGKQDLDTLAANASSAALMLSDIPWGGPIGVIRIGRISGQFVVNPSMEELISYISWHPQDKFITLRLPNFSKSTFILAVMYLDPQIRLAAEAGKQKKEYKLSMVSEKTFEKIQNLANEPIEAVFTDPTYGKFKRGEALEKITQDVKRALKEEEEHMINDLPSRLFPRAFDLWQNNVYFLPNRRIISEGLRVDGRRLDEVRLLYCEAGNLPVLHGSAIFSRGDTQVLCTTTLGAPGDAQRLDSLVGPSSKRFMLHYSFPPFCTNEVGKRTGLHYCIGVKLVMVSYLVLRPDRTYLPYYAPFKNCALMMLNSKDDLTLWPQTLVDSYVMSLAIWLPYRHFCTWSGSSTLAEKALLAVLPPEDDFPYAVRINSEVMASDGSTSMATVCGGSMALMDSGIPLIEHVAGLLMGLVSEVDSSTGEIKDYRLLTGIFGLEDHLGDMDFKIAGTRNGVTAIQLDIKPAGIPLDIICESLDPALKGMLQILEHMEREISAPRIQDDIYSPRLVASKYSNDALRRLIGPVSAMKRKIEDETGARISVSDGTFTIIAKNQSVMEKVQEKVDFIIGREIEIGGVYKGIVVSVKEYGAFVEFNGGQQGLLHISELSHDQVSRVSDVVSVGKQLSLMCIGQDVHGNIKLSLKATLPRPKSKTGIYVDAPTSQEVNVWAAIEDVSNEQKNQGATVGPETNDSTLKSATPAVLIRSAAEYDEEKSDALNSKGDNGSRSASKSEKKTRIPSSLSESSFSSRSAKKSKRGKDAILDLISDDASEQKPTPEVGLHSQIGSDKDDATSETPMSANKLKLGMRLTAKVHQIRALGLVLDLGGGIRGMYCFEPGMKRDFEVGDEQRVKWSSFSTKGIAVLSLVKEQ